MRTTLVAGGLRPARLERLLSLSTMLRVETVAERYPMQATIVYQPQKLPNTQSQSLFSSAHEFCASTTSSVDVDTRSRGGRPDLEGMRRIQLRGQATKRVALPAASLVNRGSSGVARGRYSRYRRMKERGQKVVSLDHHSFEVGPITVNFSLPIMKSDMHGEIARRIESSASKGACRHIHHTAETLEKHYRAGCRLSMKHPCLGVDTTVVVQ